MSIKENYGSQPYNYSKMDNGTGHLGCRRAGSRPRLPSPCSRTGSSQSSPPSRRTGSGARTRRDRSCTSTWHRHVQRVARISPCVTPPTPRERVAPRTCGANGPDLWRCGEKRNDATQPSRSSGQSRQHRTTDHTRVAVANLSTKP